jgi:S1-C subfamily serine protease
MNCVCGHPEKDHVQGGRCRVPDCPCELFRPGDTLRGPAWGTGPEGPVGCRHAGGAGASAPRTLAWLLGLLLALPGLAGAADGPAPPASFARLAAAARAATIVLRVSDAGDGLVVGETDDEEADLAPLEAESALFEREARTLASGIVVDPGGLALTSARAVLLTPGFEVFLVDGTRVKATVLAVDRRTDVAVLKLDSGGVALRHLPLGDSDRVEAGDWVIAVGAPMGLEGTVTAGVVTATPGPAGASPLAGFLQTDAAMDLGNLGGPVVSLAGEVVGLSTMLSGNGVAYVRPSTTVRRVYLQLLEKGRVSRPWLGIATQSLTRELARALGARDGTGVLVADVHPDGPGPDAGLRPGDIVVALDATPVSSRAQLERAVGALRPGRTVTVSVRRAARELRLAVRIGEEPDEWQAPPALARARRVLGIEARPITPTMGVRAARVDPGSPAGHAGLAAGDIIREIDRRPIRTMADFQAAVRSLDPRLPVLLQIQRGELAVYVALALRRPAD